jgi:16S rRNA (cytosine1402-N4)-methyltransferase
VRNECRSTEIPHQPVLLHEILSYFREVKDVAVYVDGTLGAGGHALGVLKQFDSQLKTMVCFDMDPTARALAVDRLTKYHTALKVFPIKDLNDSVPRPSKLSLPPEKTMYLVYSNFSKLAPSLQLVFDKTEGIVDAALLDLGISSMQVDDSQRGFSFLRDGPLDMRMDPNAILSAEEVVNTWSEVRLGEIFREYGEERYWKSIARRIVNAREEGTLRTTGQLVAAIGSPGGRDKRVRGETKHPATRVFQAIRIAVNGELQSIADVLPAAIDALSPGGRLAVITFHSLEDRIVKWAFRQAAGMTPSDESLPGYCVPFTEASKPKIKLLTKRPVTPSDEEVQENTRSRSAKLRVVEKLQTLS